MKRQQVSISLGKPSFPNHFEGEVKGKTIGVWFDIFTDNDGKETLWIRVIDGNKKVPIKVAEIRRCMGHYRKVDNKLCREWGHGNWLQMQHFKTVCDEDKPNQT